VTTLTLLEGDCLQLLKNVPDGSVDMVLADLPYGTTACKWDSIIPLEPLWEQYIRVCKPESVIVLFGSQPFTTQLIASNMRMFKYCWVWEKNRPTGVHHAKNMPLKLHEDIAVFSPSPIVHASLKKSFRMPYYPQGVTQGKEKTVEAYYFSNLTGPRSLQYGKKYQSHTGYPVSLLRFSKSEAHLHPTEKPVPLLEYLIRTYTSEGQTVLDNTMGSGSTGVACVNTQRCFIGMELDPVFYELARERVLAAHKALGELNLAQDWE